jgi:TRAP-type C4-dicarboxylate transport system substrate-binding protein
LAAVSGVLPVAELASGCKRNVIDGYVSDWPVVVGGNDVNSVVAQTGKSNVCATPYIALITRDIFHQLEGDGRPHVDEK